MAGTLPYYILVCLLLLLSISTFSYARQPSNHRLFSTAKSPRLGAEQLIRSLNLFPKHAINRFDENYSPDTTSKLVEKKLNLQILGNPGPGLSIGEFGQFAGYYRLPHTKSARMFYFFFESRNNNTDDPVVIWLTGGPGCSSSVALFYENGPVYIADNMTLLWNDYGWDLASNIIFVDQPTGTGFSYTKNESDIRHDGTDVSNDLYNFLQEFFKGHPRFVKNDFFITGESYAGHYIPALASRVHQGNKKKEGIPINLKGFAIGNGMTNPAIQYKAYPDFALQVGLIQQSDHDRISRMIPRCENATTACGKGGEAICEKAYYLCNEVFSEIMSLAGDVNYYDIRKKCQGSLCYDFSNMEKFLSMKEVKTALGVGDIEFVSCSSNVYNAMLGDWMKNYELGIPTLLEDGIRVLIFAGEKDLICNWLGNWRWVLAMKWSGQRKFEAAPEIAFVVDGSEAGKMKSYGPLTFLKVHKAGHMVPMDQPKAALEMLTTWMQGNLSTTTSIWN